MRWFVDLHDAVDFYRCHGTKVVKTTVRHKPARRDGPPNLRTQDRTHAIRTHERSNDHRQNTPEPGTQQRRLAGGIFRLHSLMRILLPVSFIGICARLHRALQRPFDTRPRASHQGACLAPAQLFHPLVSWWSW